VRKGWVSAMAHITGGGITENLPRVLARNTQAVVELGSWPVPKVFSYLARIGKIERDELLRTFNMGAGMILVVPAKHVSSVERELKRCREKFYRIGHVTAGSPRVAYGGRLSV
jgi:phosphoribosylformylglycinamidine cyclo-ligase